MNYIVHKCRDAVCILFILGIHHGKRAKNRIGQRHDAKLGMIHITGNLIHQQGYAEILGDEPP